MQPVSYLACTHKQHHSALEVSNFLQIAEKEVDEEGTRNAVLRECNLQVDLVLCYDANASPIRDIQRSGRTGRHRQGRVIHIMAAGKEEQSYKRQQLVRSDSHESSHFLVRCPSIRT